MARRMRSWSSRPREEVRHRSPSGAGCVMGGRATAAATPPRPAWEARPAPRGRPGLPDRHRLCPPEWHPLGDATAGDGLWLRHDLLAPAAVLAAARGLEEVAA